jgi:hypothetical protein
MRMEDGGLRIEDCGQDTARPRNLCSFEVGVLIDEWFAQRVHM